MGDITEDICIICQDELYGPELINDITKLPCSHFYHNNCIIDWIYENWNKYEIPI